MFPRLFLRVRVSGSGFCVGMGFIKLGFRALGLSGFGAFWVYGRCGLFRTLVVWGLPHRAGLGARRFLFPACPCT